MILILGILLGIAIALYLFFHFYPPFGGRTSRRMHSKVTASANFMEGKFVNQVPTPIDFTFRTVLSMMRDYRVVNPRRRPAKPLKPIRLDVQAFTVAPGTHLSWFGHSTFLVHVASKNILFDPIFSRSASPFQSIGPQRFSDGLPLELSELPTIDAVVVSHDHYDHLDYRTIKQLRTKVGMFYVPLGLGAHLRKWGVPLSRITELDWWEEAQLDDITLACVPSRHFSGRTWTDHFSTLWCSWVLLAPKTRLYFSGDSGYGPHFSEIGAKYGPFDLALIECGQYDTHWPLIHLLPEQVIDAALDLKARQVMPVHWGAFVLAMHDWTEPVQRLLAASASKNMNVITPRIGEIVHLGKTHTQEHWWKEYE